MNKNPMTIKCALCGVEVAIETRFHYFNNLHGVRAGWVIYQYFMPIGIKIRFNDQIVSLTEHFNAMDRPCSSVEYACPIHQTEYERDIVNFSIHCAIKL